MSDNSPPNGAPGALTPDRRALLEERVLASDLMHELGNIVYVLELELEGVVEALGGGEGEEAPEVLAGQVEYMARLGAVATAFRDQIDQRSGPPGGVTDLAALTTRLGGRLGLAVQCRVPTARVQIDAELATLAIEDLAREAARSGAPVELTLDVEPSTSRFRVGRIDVVLTVRTPGTPAPRARLLQEVARHYKGGAAMRGGRLGVSVAHSIVRGSQGILLPASDRTGDLDPDTWFEARWSQVAGG